MRGFLIVFVVLLVAAGSTFFYLVGQADAGAPASEPVEVEIDVDLAR